MITGPKISAQRPEFAYYLQKPPRKPCLEHASPGNKHTDTGSTHTHAALCIQFSQSHSGTQCVGHSVFLILPAEGHVVFLKKHLPQHEGERGWKGFFSSARTFSFQLRKAIHVHLTKADFLGNNQYNQSYALQIEPCPS